VTSDPDQSSVFRVGPAQKPLEPWAESGDSGSMRIALAQCNSTTDPHANLEMVRDHVARAAAAGAEVVVFPEATMCSFARPRLEAAQPLDGAWATEVRTLASAAGVLVVVGMFTSTGSQRVRNTLLATGRGVEAHYDKIHLFDALGYAESDQIEAGDTAVVVELGTSRIGLATCYDIRFPSLFTHLASQGAEVILVPASWAPGPGKVAQWRTLAIARAMDSTSFVVAVDQAEPPPVGGSRQPTGVGHSMVVDPFGTVLLELDTEPELAMVDLDLADAAVARERLPVLRHARRFD